MQAELYFLRIVHIVGGIFWVGGATTVAFFVFPSVAEAGPAGGAIMQGLAKRKYMVVVPVSALLTMLAGLRLMARVSGGFSSAYFSTPSGMTFGISAVIVFLAFGHGMATARPLANRSAQIAGLMADPTSDKAALGAEMKQVQAKLGSSLKITSVLLLIAAAGMALGRYM